MAEDLRDALEDQYGDLPEALEEVIKAGEAKLGDRLHLLKLADKYGWASVTDFQEEELARSPSEEKKLKRIRKDVEERKREKAGKSGTFRKKGGGSGASGSGGSSGNGDRDNRYGLCFLERAKANPYLLGRKGPAPRPRATTAVG